jgi:hypothetical protein
MQIYNFTHSLTPTCFLPGITLLAELFSALDILTYSTGLG